jgi:hypothetical protein
MGSRILGALAMIIGLAGVAAAAYGALIQPRTVKQAMEIMPGGIPQFNFIEWRSHWWMWSAAIGATSLCWLYGGTSIFLGRAGGYLYIAFATAGLAIFPWALKLNGGKLYSYEHADIPETVIYLSIAACAFITFFSTRRKYLTIGSSDRGASSSVGQGEGR